MPPALTWRARGAIILIAIFGFCAVARAQTVRPEVVVAGERIRDVRQGPDGLLYVLTDSPRGRLLRVQPN